jgi:hypothetical protein
MGWNLTIIQREHRFDQTCDASRSFQMADVCLHRADETRPVLRAAFPHYFTQGSGFNGVSEWRARAMSLYVADVGGRNVAFL